jgi:tetratricopeptide (TPR) repeat protein
LNLGKFLLAHGRAEDAIEPLNRALNLAPGSDESRMTLAVAESQLGHPVRVIELLQGHEQLDSPLFASLLGSAYCDEKDFERAIPLLEAAIRQHGEEKQLYLQLATAMRVFQTVGKPSELWSKHTGVGWRMSKFDQRWLASFSTCMTR